MFACAHLIQNFYAISLDFLEVGLQFWQSLLHKGVMYTQRILSFLELREVISITCVRNCSPLHIFSAALGIRVIYQSKNMSQRASRGFGENSGSASETVANSICDHNIRDRSELGNPEIHEILVKRSYNFHKRSLSGPKELSKKKQRRINASSNVYSLSRETFCCKSRRCFQNTDIDYLHAQAIRILNMSNDERRRVLNGFLDRNEFVFNRQPVCTNFLNTSFLFSRDLLCAVKGTPKAKGPPGVVKKPRARRAAAKMDYINKNIDTIARINGDLMPDSSSKAQSTETHLPFFRKRDVYNDFVSGFEEYRRNGSCLSPPAANYFYREWHQNKKNIKVRKVHRFAKCTDCEYYDSELRRCEGNEVRAAPIIFSRSKHLKQMASERDEYTLKRTKAQSNPNHLLSLIIDGADQSAFGLPHFSQATKSEKGHSIKVRLIGTLVHGPHKRLFLHTMTQEYETGGNHVIEALHRVLQSLSQEKPLQPVLYAQLDKRTREKKNRYVLSYLECLVAWGVFKETHASFLPVGHTHEDIDQCFSRTSTRLSVEDAVTMSDLWGEFCKSYTPSPHVSGMNNVANFSGLLSKERCLLKVPPFSHFRYFRFLETEQSPGNQLLKNTRCLVKVWAAHDWEPLKCDGSGFISRLPDLKNTPETRLAGTARGDASEVDKRLDSAEERVRDCAKMNKLRELRDKVFTDRAEPFHWDLLSCIE